TDPLDGVRKRSRCQVHEVKLEAGKAYSIDLHSLQFKAALRLEDAQARPLAASDVGAAGPGAWLVFVPAQAGTYRLVVTTTGPGQLGAYWLTVQQYGEGAAARRRHDLEEQAAALHRQGNRKLSLGDYRQARTCYQQALQRRQQLYPSRHYPRGHP